MFSRETFLEKDVSHLANVFFYMKKYSISPQKV